MDWLFVEITATSRYVLKTCSVKIGNDVVDMNRFLISNVRMTLRQKLYFNLVCAVLLLRSGGPFGAIDFDG